MSSRWKWISFFGLGVVAALVSVGTFRAYSRGANDFSVFYEAWKLVLAGRGAEIYRVSPDRYLYGPGFAWLLAPFGLLSKNSALGIWCLIKAFIIGFLIKELSKPWVYKNSGLAVGISAWGVVLISRPLLIDLEYGQVNLLILGACIWGLLGHFGKKSSPLGDTCRWTVLTLAAFAKLFPLPLLLVPWVITSGISIKKLKYERQAIVIGFLLTFLIPVLSQGWLGTLHLLTDWREAVLARGLPLESHNQSFTAFLNHYLSGNPTSVLSEGAQPLFFGHAWLSPGQIVLISLFWTSSALGIILGWILSGASHSPVRWIAVIVGLLIVPSHLIWKPYFVMSMPLAILIVHQSLIGNRPKSLLSIIALFAVINLTSFDFVGHDWAAHFEAGSLLLVAHVVMIIMAISGGESLGIKHWEKA